MYANIEVIFELISCFFSTAGNAFHSNRNEICTHLHTAARQSKQLIFIHSVISNALLMLRMQIVDVTDNCLAHANQIDLNQYAICMLHNAIWYRYLPK